jgi:hypothetical protein
MGSLSPNPRSRSVQRLVWRSFPRPLVPAPIAAVAASSFQNLRYYVADLATSCIADQQRHAKHPPVGMV